ncbi:g2171 [Coccomyxa elongata]
MSSTASAPSDDIVAAALEEALQNARLLRVSSSIFLKEAKELLDSGRAAALLWAADCLEGLNEVERERLAGVKEATETNSVPLVPVQSKKQLAEWVQLGKIGRLRRNAACLLAVVLHSADGAESDEAAALTKLLDFYPQAPKPLPKPVITQRVSSAGSTKVTTPSSAKASARHSYTPDPVKFRAAMASKDTLPVLKRTGSSTPSSRRESVEGGSTLPSWALSRRESLAAAEAAASPGSDPAPAATAASPEPPTAAPKQAAIAVAPSASSEHAAASATPTAAPHMRAAAVELQQSDGQPSAPGPKGAREISTSGVVGKAEPVGSSEAKAAEPAAAPAKKTPEKASSDPLAAGGSSKPSTAPKVSPQKPVAAANGNSTPAKLQIAQAAAPAAPSPVEPADAEAPNGNPAPVAVPEKATPAAKAAPASDAFTPGAGLPSSANAMSAAEEEATPQQTVPLGSSGRAASVARPEEVSAFRMSRRKRTSSAAAAPKAAEEEATPGEPAENGSSSADALAARGEA